MRLIVLDGIRGVAAVLVALHHFMWFIGAGGLGPIPQFAVDAFFILSGFVMARTYEQRMRTGLSAPSFIALRYRRLWFPMFAGTTLGLVHGVLYGGTFIDLATAYAVGLLFLPTVWMPVAFWLNTPAWSLFLEILANAIHGSVLWRIPTKPLLGIAAACAVVSGALMPFGLGVWHLDTVSIISLLPREMAVYICGVVIFRVRGDSLFDADLSPTVARIATALGALSYPLYATHLAALAVGADLEWRPLTCFAFAVGVAVATTVGDARLRVPSRSADRATMSDWLIAANRRR